ncbi:MAG: DUF882 domain-containing protein [Tagaea sp.]|nr:DUF882 domain-containing protein [Tagaea sp.]
MEHDDDSPGGACDCCEFDFPVSRRGALGALAAGISGFALLAGTAEAAAPSRRRTADRSLSVVNAKTGEIWRGVYWRENRLVPQAYGALTEMFRDVRADRTGDVDVALLHGLWRVRARIGAEAPWRILSGFRTERTHDAIKRANRSAARNSFHVQGKAVDVAMDGVSPRVVARAARAEGVGGVGLYARRGFVHLDTGPRRNWTR